MSVERLNELIRRRALTKREHDEAFEALEAAQRRKRVAEEADRKAEWDIRCYVDGEYAVEVTDSFTADLERRALT